MANKNEADVNLQWFNFYVRELESAPASGFRKFREYYLCPCCYFPTLKARNEFDICPLCNWEDDGQDDHNADLVLGGPNSDYSLTEARENFKLYLTSYRPTHTHPFEMSTGKKVLGNQRVVDLIVLKKQIIELYNAAMSSEDFTMQRRSFGDALKLIMLL